MSYLPLESIVLHTHIFNFYDSKFSKGLQFGLNLAVWTESFIMCSCPKQLEFELKVLNWLWKDIWIGFGRTNVYSELPQWQPAGLCLFSFAVPCIFHLYFEHWLPKLGLWCISCECFTPWWIRKSYSLLTWKEHSESWGIKLVKFSSMFSWGCFF